MLTALGLALALASAVPQQHHRSAVTSHRASLPELSLGRGAALTLEIAADAASREKGLSGRKVLDWDRGMLFVFPDAGRRVFWMIDCHFDIDVAYLNRAGLVRDVITMRAEPGVPASRLLRYPSSSDDIVYALEVNRGWFEAHGIRPGTMIRDVTRWTTRR